MDQSCFPIYSSIFNFQLASFPGVCYCERHQLPDSEEAWTARKGKVPPKNIESESPGVSSGRVLDLILAQDKLIA